MSALDNSTVQEFYKLRDYVVGPPSSTSSTASTAPSRSGSSRVLMERETDATVDSDGYPAPKCDDGAKEEFPSPCDLPDSELAKAALSASPPPVLKSEWRELVSKKPAASKATLTPAAKAPGKHDVVKKAKVKAMKSNKAQAVDFKINSNSISTGGGQYQTYIQHIPKGASSKQLIVAVSDHMVDGLKCSHKEAIKLLMPSCMKAGAKRSDVLAARAKLLSELGSK